MSAEGWKELFRPELGYAGDVELQEFDILIKEDSAESIYHFFVEGSYLVALLDAEAKENLKRRLIDVIAEHQRADGTLEMAFPLRMLSVHKP